MARRVVCGPSQDEREYRLQGRSVHFYYVIYKRPALWAQIGHGQYSCPISENTTANRTPTRHSRPIRAQRWPLVYAVQNPALTRIPSEDLALVLLASGA